MEYQNYDSIVFFILLAGFALSLWKSLKKPSFHDKARADRRFERADATTKGDLNQVIIKFDRAERAEKAQRDMTKRIIDHIRHLEHLIKEEERLLPETIRLVKAEHFDDAGQGIKEGGVIAQLCEEEDRVINDEILELFGNPEKLAGRIKKLMEHENKEIRDDLRTEDAAAAEGIHEDALDSGEIHRIHKEDEKGRETANDAEQAAHEERDIVGEFHATRRYCEDIMRVNNTIIKLTKAKTKSEHAQLKDLSEIEDLVQKKQEKLNHIIDSLKLIEKYEDKLIEDTEEAIRDDKAAMAA